MLQAKIQQLSEHLIRPKRRNYKQQDLGPCFFKSKHGFCSHKDFSVPFKYFQTYGYPNKQRQSMQELNNSTIQLKCSIFYPCSYSDPLTKSSQSLTNKNQSHQDRICMLAMHGNTGSRMSTLSNLEPALELGCALAIFDFGGCGNSQGQFVTLGYHEKHQISAVLDQIHRNFGFHKFILYGRSMGAASALFYSTDVYPIYASNKQKKVIEYFRNSLENNLHIQEEITEQKDIAIIDVISKLNVGYFGYQVIGAILDSPYCNGQKMAFDAVKTRAWFLPNFLINYALGIVQERANRRLVQNGLFYSSSKNQSDTTPQTLNQIKLSSSFLSNIRLPQDPYIPYPVFVMYGLHDNVISQNHTWELFQEIQCEFKKLLVLQNQGHGDHRSQKIKSKAIQWVLEIQVQRISNRLQRDAKLLGITVENMASLSNRIKLNTEDQITGNKLPIQKFNHRQKEKSTQMATERTGSLASLKVKFGSMTCSSQVLNQKQAANQYYEEAVEHETSLIFQTIQSEKIENGFSKNQKQQYMRFEGKRQYRNQCVTKIQKLKSLQQQQEILDDMSRIFPYKKFNKRSIQMVSKQVND